jgi:Skp family chaperone for outer membrane proteins
VSGQEAALEALRAERESSLADKDRALEALKASLAEEASKRAELQTELDQGPILRVPVSAENFWDKFLFQTQVNNNSLCKKSERRMLSHLWSQSNDF